MSYQKTLWVEHETLVSAENLNRIEDELESLSLNSATKAELGGKADRKELIEIEEKLESIGSEKDFSIVKSNKDQEGIFTVVTYNRKADNTKYCVSTLSGGVTPFYTTRTEQFYNAAGTEVIKTNTYTLSYDADGELLSEV